jgi:hypothetical protein
MSIPDEAVEAAAKALDPQTMGSGGALAEKFKEQTRAEARRILEAAAPYLMAEVERELSDAKRMIALLVLEAGGKVAISRRAVAELSNETVIETMQDVVNGGWVIRTGGSDG